MKTSRLPIFIWALCLAGFVASVLLLAPGLPAQVATHFNGSGNPNGWMPREYHTAFFIVFGTGFSSFVIGICYGIRFLPAACLNVPHPEYWRSAAHFPEACDFLFRQAFWVGALSAIWVAFFNDLIVRANRVSPAVLDFRALAILSIAYFAGLACWISFLVRHFRNIPRRSA